MYFFDQIIILKDVNRFIDDSIPIGRKLSYFLLYSFEFRINIEFKGDYLWVNTWHVGYVPSESMM